MAAAFSIKENKEDQYKQRISYKQRGYPRQPHNMSDLQEVELDPSFTLVLSNGKELDEVVVTDVGSQ